MAPKHTTYNTGVPADSESRLFVETDYTHIHNFCLFICLTVLLWKLTTQKHQDHDNKC